MNLACCLLLLFPQLLCGLRGVNETEYQMHYSNPDTFQCLSDSSVRISATQVNDDYCDCIDGSDEPGTSACDYKFYCENAGHQPQHIFSSRVNDGICDCCDGADEYSGFVECADGCAALAEKLRLLRLEKERIRKEGITKKVAWIQEAVVEMQKLKEELATLEQDKQSYTTKLAELQFIKDKEEEIEEKERQAKKHGLMSDEDEAMPMADGSYSASQDNEDEDEDHDPKIPVPSIFSRFKGWLLDMVDEYIYSLPSRRSADDYKRPEAETARTNYNSQQTLVDNTQERIDKINKIFDTDYGEQKEFYMTTKECLNFVGEYTYKFCPFGQVTQGYTSLGDFSGWKTTEYENYGTTIDRSVQHYTGGVYCHGGPDRSATVVVQCGLENKILSVSELVRCEYQLVWETPAACSMEEDEAASN
eukprot:TRINITY_DN112540_c0_g1_i1.p2 TRINITY_DN112540_c0_g1~~TRINITY_DN112540_c0_g1_i1.p2  ORF type:complete len:419 (+),score=50.39 TRINITY_DN112540_c0_g1_i1:20-1276(+)